MTRAAEGGCATSLLPLDGGGGVGVKRFTLPFVPSHQGRGKLTPPPQREGNIPQPGAAVLHPFCVETVDIELVGLVDSV